MTESRIEEIRKLLPRCLLPDWVRLGRRFAWLLRHQYHPEQRGALLNRLLEQAHASIALREERRLNLPKVTYPPEKDEIVAAIRNHQVVVIAGETGSGKTNIGSSPTIARFAKRSKSGGRACAANLSVISTRR